MPSSFVHLHTHSHYSLLDGASRTGDLVDAALADGQPALAVTDHGNMYGVIDFYKECQKKGIKFIPAIEAYQAKEHVDERPAKARKRPDDMEAAEGGEKAFYHLTLLAETTEGYHNLIKLSSRAYLKGFYMKPRIDWEALQSHSEGIVATTGCLGGQVLQALLRNDQKGAEAIAGRLQDIFGKDNLFVEIQDHDIPAQKQTMDGLLQVAKAIGAPLVATNDSHYVHAEDAVPHDALLCLQTGAKISDEKRFRFESDQHYLKSAVEMRQLFAELPDACDNTLWIAERSNVVIPFGQMHLPQYPVPEGFADDSTYLSHLVLQGAKERWGTLTEEQSDRITYELRVIKDMGFSSYFLIVWDLCDYARKQGIRTGPGRGSAAGSAVSYCLRITGIDPIENKLPFERFLNPDRVSMPDIDLDVDTRYRDRLISYTSDRYGEDRVAQIITYSRIKARSAVRDAARVLDKPFAIGNKLSAAIPKAISGREVSLADCFDPGSARFAEAQSLRELYNMDPECHEVLDVARRLEGLTRQDGIHAAAVVIGDSPITDLAPVQRKRIKDSKDWGPITIQYDMRAVEDLGLLKMDFLGLRNLDTITDTLALIKKTRGIDLDIDNIPLDDPATFKLLREAQTIGCFQIESREMRSLIKRLQPTSFDDIGALVALYRPGPMGANMHNDYADRKNGRQVVQTFHPDANHILGSTFGLMIYQESVMEVAKLFAGYTLAQADTLRKAMGKKLPEKMAEEKARLVQGCVKNGYGEQFGAQLFSMIEKFADYGFNKAHAYGYGYISYQTAYLKANYPAEYMAALCSGVADKIEKATKFLAEARDMGLKVLVPNVNKSGVHFGVVDGGVSVGLSAIRGIGQGLAQIMVEEREKHGPYMDLFDFVRRLVPAYEGGKAERTGIINKKVFIALAQAGALDCFGQTRRGMIGIADEILSAAKKLNKGRSSGQLDMFGQEAVGFNFDISPVEYHTDEKMRREKDAMGIYVTGHPLDDVPELVAQAEISVEDLEEAPDGLKWITAVVTGIETKVTKRQETMAVVTAEDKTGSIQIVAFPRQWTSSNLEQDTIARLLVRAGDDYRDERQYVLVDEQIHRRAQVREEAVRIYLPDKFSRDDTYVAKLKGLILSHRGEYPVKLHISKGTVIRLDEGFLVNNSPKFREDLKSLMKEFSSR